MNWVAGTIFCAILLHCEFVYADYRNLTSVIDKCCESSYRECCKKALEFNSTFDCASESDFQSVIGCIELEFFGKSLMKSGADYCCSFLSSRKCRDKCGENMLRPSIPIEDRLKLIEECKFEDPIEKDEPDCAIDTRRNLNKCFPYCVEWYRKDVRQKKYNPLVECIFLNDFRARNPCQIKN